MDAQRGMAQSPPCPKVCHITISPISSLPVSIILLHLLAHYVVKTRDCPIEITRFSAFFAILLATLGVLARLRVPSNTLKDALHI